MSKLDKINPTGSGGKYSVELRVEGEWVAMALLSKEAIVKLANYMCSNQLMEMAGLKAGDRVIIKAKQHSWCGYTGTFTGEELTATPGSAAPKGMYRVELDNGMAAGCFMEQLQKL